MKAETKIYITTTLPYVNSIPHIGHSLEMIQGDFIARYLKSKYKNVQFNTGVDENGLKVYTTSVEKGVDTQAHCDSLTKIWKEFLHKFHIEPNTFWRTTSETHKVGVLKAWEKCLKNDDIYEKEYSGIYCLGCESFKTTKDLVDGKCPDHPHLEPKEIKENNYFFRLSKYKEYLLEWLDKNPDFLTPKSKTEELRNLILNVEDISISRLKTSVPWGISVPNDSEQNIYVWFEALQSYFTSTGYDIERWENSIQICGSDNLRFQGVILQGILKSLSLPQTKKLLVHGTVLDNNGVKMSKSIGNVIDPITQLEKYGLSAVRFYTLGSLPTYSNCNWSETDLVSFYNAHLANNLGNLINRVITILLKNIDVNELKNLSWIKLYQDTSFPSFNNEVKDALNKVEEYLSKYEIRSAIEELNGISTYLNQYITSKEPWKKEHDECIGVLSNLYWGLSKILPYYKLILPEKEEVIDKVFHNFEKEIIFPRIEK